MLKDIEATAKEIILNNFPYPPIDKDGDEVPINWLTCKDDLHKALNDSVGCPVSETVDALSGALAHAQIELLKNDREIAKKWDNYVSDYCTDARYRTEMFNEAKRLP